MLFTFVVVSSSTILSVPSHRAFYGMGSPQEKRKSFHFQKVHELVPCMSGFRALVPLKILDNNSVVAWWGSPRHLTEVQDYEVRRQ
ncbi:hypothetical protein TNCV_4038811 [Trichonephila clavipes]|nr:hypothetical protein TNCV_4038811 [Trichonephila clavipes]